MPGAGVRAAGLDGAEAPQRAAAFSQLDLPEIGLGEVFRINGQPGEFKTERLVADADALVIERLS
jgi:hypothetical protein